MVLLDSTSAIGGLITGMTEFTGAIWVTLFILMMFMFIIMVSLRIPIYFAIVFLLPFMIVGYMMTASFLPVIGGVVFYLSIVIAKQIVG